MQLRLHLRKDAAWCAVILLLIVGHFWFPQFGTGGERDTYSTGSHGKKMFYRLLQDDPFGRNVAVRRNTEPLGKLFGSSGVRIGSPNDARQSQMICILGPARYPNIAEWDLLLEWVSRGGNLIVAANDQKPEFEIEALDVQVRRVDGGIDADGEQIDTGLISSGLIAWQSRAEIVATPRATRLLSAGGTTQIVRQSHGSGAVVVVAGDFLFSNQSIAFGDNAFLAMQTLEAASGNRDGADEVVFDEALNLSGRAEIVGLLLKPEFKPMTLQLLIAVALFAWWRSRRFGPLQPEATPPRQDVVEHTDAVGTLLYRTGDGAAALRSYLRQLFVEIKLKMYRGKEERVIEPLAYKMGKDPEDVKRLLQRAAKATKSKRLDRREAAHLLRQLAVVRRAAQQKSRQSARPPDAQPPPLAPVGR